MRTRLSVGSKEYVGAPIRELTGIDFTALPVELAFTATVEEADDVGTVWTPGEWKTVQGSKWAVTLIGPGSPRGALTPGRYWLHFRPAGNPEVPILTSPTQITLI